MTLVTLPQCLVGADQNAVLALMAAGKVTIDDASARLSQITRAATNAAKASPPKSVYFRVSPKGCMSAYGINSRMPVSMYAEQWYRLLTEIDALWVFLSEHVEQPGPTKAGSEPRTLDVKDAAKLASTRNAAAAALRAWGEKHTLPPVENTPPAANGNGQSVTDMATALVG